MVNTPTNGREAAHTASESSIRTPQRSGLLKTVSATVLASSMAALVPSAADAQGFANAIRIDDEKAVQFMGVRGTGYEATAVVSPDNRKVTVTGGPAGSEVVVTAACTPGEDYNLEVTGTRLNYRLDEPTKEEKKRKNVYDVHVDMAATGQNYMRLACKNGDRDPKKMQLVFVNNPNAKATGTQSVGSDSVFGEDIHMGITPALSIEGIAGDGVALGLGGFVHGAYQVADFVDVGLRVGALAQPVDANDINRDGTPTGTIYTTYSPLFFGGVEFGLGNDIRFAPGFGIAHAAGHNTDGYTEIDSSTDPVASLALSGFVGEAGEPQLELTGWCFSDFKHDETTACGVAVGLAQ